MRARRLLLASAALSSAIACGGNKKKTDTELYANPKGSRYDQGLQDAGTDAAPMDGTSPMPPAESDPHPK